MKSSKIFHEPVTIFPVHYSFYLPYSVIVIVLYEDFRAQLRQRATKPQESILRSAVLLMRLAFWCAVNEVVHHVIFMNPFMNNVSIMNQVDEVTLVCIVYMAGHMFQLKYVCIFGLPSWFAAVDGMDPPGPPVCVSTVLLYSRMWRHFDRGLYQFMKRRLYLPLLRLCSTSGWFVRAVALLGSYLFVLQWHGFDDKHRRWITLSVLEILLERVGHELYRVDRVRNALHDKLSETMFRRLVAVLQIVCGAFGCFGAFNFLGGDGVGEAVATRTWWTHGPRLDHFFWHLVLLGYCISQCALEIDRRRAHQSTVKSE